MLSHGELLLLGRYGANIYTSASGAKTGTWAGIENVGTTNATFSTLTASNSDALAAVVLLPSQTLILPFTAITVTAGTIVAFKEPAL